MSVRERHEPTPRSGPSPAAPRRAGRRLLRLAGAAAVLAIAATLVSVAEVNRRLATPFRGFAGDEIFVEVPQGSGVNAIARRLAQAGVVRDEYVFRLAVWKAGAGRTLKAGEYRFADPATPGQVVDRLVRGDVALRTITFPEGLTIREMAAVFEQRGLGAASAFLAAARRPDLVAQLDPAAKDLEGYLFPDTYAVPRGATAADLVGLMVERFEAVFRPAWQARGPAMARSVRETVTLASLVEKETAVAGERPVVAAVYANRLRIGMPMQCDPTVIYALMLAGRWTGNITRNDLQVDSRYNTYRYPGLPPGPIASPGKGAIEAALAPAEVGYLYFVSRNDGSHEFAATLTEHNRNVQRFQVEYFRNRRGRERTEAGTRGER
jgi:UPF0755 protein